MLNVRNLTVHYGPISAVRSISFSIRRGEIVALLGANGAGKTSTLEAITGLHTEAEGSVEVFGEEVLGLKAEEIVRRRIALSPEGRRVFPSLTVGENLLVAALDPDDKNAEDELRESLLELFPVLRTRFRAHADELSGGEQQQLAIARALMSRPEILLLDEPSLGLAPKMVSAMFDLIADLQGRGLSILLVEQNLHQTLAIADRAYVLRSGNLELSGTPEELAATNLEARFLGLETS